MPLDMIVLAEPVPEDMISAIGKAIKLLPKIDTYAMHAQMKDLYSWSDVAFSHSQRLYGDSR